MMDLPPPAISHETTHIKVEKIEQGQILGQIIPDKDLIVPQVERKNSNPLSPSWEMIEGDPSNPQGSVPNCNPLGCFDYLASWTTDGNHPSKQEKYAAVMQQYLWALKGLQVDPVEVFNSLKDTLGTNYQGNELPQLVFRCLSLLLFSHESMDPRRQYRQFVEALDLAYEKADQLKLRLQPRSFQEDLLITLIEDMSYARWTRVEMFNYLKKITDLTVNAFQKDVSGEDYQISNLTIENFPEALFEINKIIRLAPTSVKKPKMALQLQKFLGEFGFKNYTGTENTPNVATVIVYQDGRGNTQEIEYLRHGSPTTAGTLGRVVLGFFTRPVALVSGKDVAVRSGEKLVPNYIAFLEAAARRGEGVFYVSHLRIQPDFSGNERDKLEQIMQAQKRHENFFVLVQPVEGPLFEKKGKYAKFESFSQLKRALVQEFFENGENSTCALPFNLIDDSKYKETFQQLFEDVHQIFFDAKKKLASEEWPTFLLTFYVFQRIDLKFRLGEKSGFPIKFFNTTCKDDLDRGGMTKLFELILHLFWMGKENEDSYLKDILYNILGAPIAVKKKEMIEHRLIPGLRAINHVRDHFKNSPRAREAFMAYRFGEKKWHVQDFKAELRTRKAKSPHQKSKPYLKL